MSIIEEAGQVRTHNWVYMMYMKHARGHELITRWYRPRVYFGLIFRYKVSYTLCPPLPEAPVCTMEQIKSMA